MDKMDTYTRWKQNPSKGEVFTPKRLVRRMLDKIPVEVWENPKSTFCDLSMGKGTFLVEIVNRLVDIYKYSEEGAKSRVFGYEIRVKYVNYLTRRGYKNLHVGDSLEKEFDMKFDVVIGNPPYQETNGGKIAKAIWPMFVEKSFEICEEGGYVSLIHPNGWRDVSGKYKKTQEILKNKNILYLEMHNIQDGVKTFGGVKTPYDWYVIENNPNINQTLIKTQTGERLNAEINGLEYIPNSEFNKVVSLIVKDSEEPVETLHSYSSYEHRKGYMSKTQTEEYRYPCVYSILKDGTIKLMYSSTNEKGHFSIPKLILGNGANPTSFIDYNGDYGMTEFSYGIVDSIENLEKIQLVLKSEEFQKINLATKYVTTQGNPLAYPKIITTFKKDFWKYFLDEDNNVIEPNFENVERV